VLGKAVMGERRNSRTGKKDLETHGLSSNASKPIRSAAPLGMEGGEQWGWAGALGLADPANLFPAARRRWRVGCLQAGALTARTSAKVRISSQRDSEAAGGSAQDDVIFNEPGRRSRCRAGRRREPICRGFTRQRDTAMGGITDNISCAAAGIAKPTPSLATK
jgi:hypothetical protein